MSRINIKNYPLKNGGLPRADIGLVILAVSVILAGAVAALVLNTIPENPRPPTFMERWPSNLGAE